MKKICYIAILVLVVTTNSVISYAASGPKLVIDAKEFDFKEVQEGKAITHTFKALNKGDQALEIHRINPG